MAKTYYEILGVERNASKLQLYVAYTEQLLSANPEEMSACIEAYEILKDPEKRQKYDKSLAQKNTTPLSEGTLSIIPETLQPEIKVRVSGNQQPTNKVKVSETDENQLMILAPMGKFVSKNMTIEKMIQEFESFKGGYLNSEVTHEPASMENSFCHEIKKGPPREDVFIFPDEASANAFVQSLLNKGYIQAVVAEDDNSQVQGNGHNDVREMKAELREITSGSSHGPDADSNQDSSTPSGNLQ